MTQRQSRVSSLQGHRGMISVDVYVNVNTSVDDSTEFLTEKSAPP